MTMSANFVSTPSLAMSLVLPVQQAQASLASATTEESTGQYADLGLMLGDQSGYELSLKEQVGLLQALTSANGVVSTNMATADAALTAIAQGAQTTMQSLAGWTPSGASSGPNLQTMGANGLQSLIASANATSGGGYVFGGINSSVRPLADYFSTPPSAAKTAVDQAFQSAFGVLRTDPAAASISASAMQSFLAGPFAALFSDPAWTSNWSSASSTNVTAEITPGQTATVSTNVNQPAFQGLAQAYTMLAEFGGSQLSPTAQQAVASQAGSLIAAANASLTDTHAALGAAQSAVADANGAMSSQISILAKQVNALDSVDPAATAARINSLTTQIQMAYELTARLQQLNLAQYLPVA